MFLISSYEYMLPTPEKPLPFLKVEEIAPFLLERKIFLAKHVEDFPCRDFHKRGSYFSIKSLGEFSNILNLSIFNGRPIYKLPYSSIFNGTNHMGWQVKHSIEVDASLQKAWEFHINIEENWKSIEGDSVEYIKLKGPYAAGTKGSTKMKGQPPMDWELIRVDPLSKSVTEFLLPDAQIHFEFTFVSLSDTQTLLSQKISLLGPGASHYIAMMEENFGQNLAPGMEKIALEMARYAENT